jgi:hypothetical protein
MAAGVTATVEDCTRLLCDRTVTEIGAGRFLYYALQPRYSLWCCPLILWHVGAAHFHRWGYRSALLHNSMKVRLLCYS